MNAAQTTNNPPELAVILPTLDECENIGPLIARLGAALGDIAWEAIIVDDDSPDGTAQEARRIARDNPHIRVIHRVGRRGLASAVIEGVGATSATYAAVMDADHQHDPALLPAMMNAVASGSCDVAVASRFADGATVDGWGEPGREKLSSWATHIAQKLTGAQLTDPLSGYFVISVDRARGVIPRLSGIGFKILLDILCAARPPLKVREFPLEFAPRRAGVSKLDKGVALDFLAALYDRAFGQIIPTRFALFGSVGAVGVLVHIAALALLHPSILSTFWQAQAAATFVAMSGNFWLNNALTYRDRRLHGVVPMLCGWAGFCATCAVGGLANVAVASLLEARGVVWLLAGLSGIIVGAVWNYAVSSRFVWSRY